VVLKIGVVFMGKARYKHVSAKKLSARKRGSFVNAQPSAVADAKTGICEICGEPLKPMEHVGTKTMKELALEGSIHDLTENGKKVWRELPSMSLCVFYDDVKCPHDAIPKEKRPSSVCLNCAEYARFMLEMETEDRLEEEEMDKERSEWDRRILDEGKSG